MRKPAIFLSIATLSFLTASAAVPAIAATTPAVASENDCTLPASAFTALVAIENNQALTATQEISQELAARKQLLAQTISCAVTDAQGLQTTLDAVTTSDDKSAAVQSQLNGKLNDAINFYNLQSAKLNNAGIASTEAIAKEMVAWRTANYDPLVGDVNNFVLWSQNQAIFQTAENRLDQTAQIVGFIESATANNNLQASLGTVQSAFESAQGQNSNAENALAEFLPPDQSLALIQQSLQSLANTYQAFTDLNDQIQKLLPTGQ